MELSGSYQHICKSQVINPTLWLKDTLTKWKNKINQMNNLFIVKIKWRFVERLFVFDLLLSGAFGGRTRCTSGCHSARSQTFKRLTLRLSSYLIVSTAIVFFNYRQLDIIVHLRKHPELRMCIHSIKPP